MADKTENFDFFDEEIESYTKKYEAVIDKAGESDFVDELFESPDGTPVTNWSMDDINKLIDDVDSLVDIEEAGEDFEEDKYEEYSEPENTAFEVEVKEEEEVYDENAVYFSKEYEKDLSQKDEEKIPTEFEDFSSFSEDFQEDDDFFETNEDSNLSAIEGHINEAREDGEFREIDETLDADGFEQVDVVYDGTFDRGDYIQIKDIFKNSKILSKRRAERAEIRESAMETVKEKYGEAVFDAKKKESDFNDILKRQRLADKEKQEETKNENPTERPRPETRFDIDTQDYVVTTRPEPEEIKVEESNDDLDDTIFMSDLSSFEEVARSNKYDVEEDLSKTKIIPDNTNTQKTGNIYISPPSRRKDDDQLIFDGFSEIEEEDFLPNEVNESEIEENLRRTREEKKNLFRMTSLPDDYDDTDPNYFSAEKGKYDDEEYMVLSDENNPNAFFTIFKNSFIQEKNKKFTEYTTSNEKPQVFKELNDRRRKSVVGVITLTLLTVLFAGISLILKAIDISDAVVSTSVLSASSIVCLLLCFVFGSSVTQPGIQGIIKKRFNFDSAVTVLIVLGIIASAASFFDTTGFGENYALYTTSILLCAVFAALSRAVESIRAINALKTATLKRQNNLYTTQSIEDEKTAENIGRILAGENPDLKYSCKTAFPSNFVSISFAGNPADRFSRKFFPIFLALSAVVGIVSGIVSRNVAVAFSSLALCAVLSFPISVMFSINTALFSLNKKLKKKNACITGYTSVRNIEKTSAVVIDSNDLFDVNKCNFHGMKDYGTVRVDDIILYAAAMLTNSKGPLAHVFDQAIIGDKSELLPEVENLCYEERLGLSGWIRGERVLIGNRNLLINHNMEAPPKGAEVGCIKEGKKVLYIAIGGQLAAMLVVGYHKNDEMKKYLSRLDKYGITVVVTTNDCNIDEEFLSLEFNMPRESFKVVGDYEGGLLDECIRKEKSSAPAKLIHDETSASFFETFTSAISYSSSIKITLAIQTVLMLVGIITAAIFAISGNLTMMSAGMVILIQLISTAVLSLLSYFRAKM